MAWSLRSIALLLLVTLLGACASRTRAPVEDRAAIAPRPSATTSPSSSATPPASAATAGAEADWRPQTYTVKRGDTLHQIALDFGMDYRELAGWNGLDNPNLILVGQVLRLTAPGDAGSAPASPGVTVAPLRSAPTVVESRPASPGVPPVAASGVPAAPGTSSSRNNDVYKSSPKALKEPYSEQAVRDVTRAATAPPPEPVVVATAAPVLTPTPAPTSLATPPMPTMALTPPRVDAKLDPLPVPIPEIEGDEKINWIWPSKGKVITNFSETANLKGIDIAGTAGQPVVASAAGTVVYAGTGLRGYGKLIIIKHNKTFLSAYAHNREILVKEGQAVAKGEKIAEMGNSDTPEVKLHFEIRRLGKPMDPARYLPPA